MTDDPRVQAYAEALYAVTRAEGNEAAVEDELLALSRAVEGNDELANALTDPHIPAERRQQIVEDLLGDKASPATIGLASMVAATGRARQLPAIVRTMVGLRATESNKAVAEVRSAEPLSEDQKARLADALGKATGSQVEVKVVIDPSIQGGLVAQIGDTVIDGSVRRRLELLRSTL